jgi:serine/threonine protein kinase
MLPEDNQERTIIFGSADPALPSPDSTGEQKFSVDTSLIAPPSSNRGDLTRLGRFRLLRKLGQGGMGTVYLGEDDSGTGQVAVKVLAREAIPDEHAVRRFQKEARLLSEVRHPHVANLLETGEIDGTCYLVMDFVSGTDLKGLLSQAGQLSERIALQIVHDVAEALAEAHRRGIVHRDIKPGNILLSAALAGDETPAAAVAAAVASGCKPLVKLTDFGLARHIEQSASLDMTKTGAMLGTPYYIAPEQCARQGDVGPATDVYSLGATLFEMLAGRPPFVASDAVKMITMHCFEEAPDVRKLNASVSDGVARLVAKTLEKKPTSRYADAAHLREEIALLLRGETNDVAVHPGLPATSGDLIETTWEWDLAASSEQLWPLVSNTERINCAVGIPPVEYTTERDEHGALHKYGTFRLGWAVLNWEEHPFEWVEGRRLGVLREFRKGPFEWFLSIVELTPTPTGGTRLKHTVRIAARSILGRLLAHIEVSVKGKRALDRIYNRIDKVATGRLHGSPALDPFEPPATLRKSTRQRFDDRREALHQAGVDADCAERLLEFLKESPAQELGRIRPHALARRLGVSPDRLTEACLHACHAGLLELHWDILCPTCRISSTVKDTLAEIDRHVRCEACDLDFDVDFGNAVELIFRIHPELRPADLKTYCIGGPEHAPHVVAQARLAVGESLNLDPALDAGAYVVRGPQLPYVVPLTVLAASGTGRAVLPLSAEFDPVRFPAIRAGQPLLTLENKFPRPLLLRIERTIPQADVLTAAKAGLLPAFRRLFPTEVLSRERLSDYSACTLLAIRADQVALLCDKWGDATAYLRISERFRSLRQAVESNGGQIVKEEHEHLLAAFPETLNAIRVAVDLFRDKPADRNSAGYVPLRAALHRGTALSTSINGRVDYFGRTVSMTTGLLNATTEHPLVLSNELGSDREVVALLDSLGANSRQSEFTDSSTGARILEVLVPGTQSESNTI